MEVALLDARSAALAQFRRARQVEPDSVVVLRSLSRHGRHVLAAECDGTPPTRGRWRGIFCFDVALLQEAEGCYIGKADAARRRSTVWSNFGAFTAGDLQVFGGWTASDAIEVVLIDGADRRVRQRVECGVVLFAERGDSFDLPVRAVLLDGSGRPLHDELLQGDERLTYRHRSG